MTTRSRRQARDGCEQSHDRDGQDPRADVAHRTHVFIRDDNGIYGRGADCPHPASPSAQLPAPRRCGGSADERSVLTGILAIQWPADATSTAAVWRRLFATWSSSMPTVD